MKHSNFLFYLIIIMILFFSGEMRIYNQILGERTAILLFFLSCLLFHLRVNRGKVNLGKYNKSVIFFLCIWIFIVSYLINHDSVSYKGLVTCIYIISIGLFSSAVNFQDLREALLRVSVIIAITSIIVQLGHDCGIFSAYPAYLENADAPRSLYIFNTEWGESRLASIYWEPGQYQIVLAYVLCLFADELSEISNWRKNIKKFGILFIAFILTRSTMGYVVFLVVIFTILLGTFFSRKKVYLYPIIIAIGYAVFLFIYNSDAIQVKIAQSENVNQDSSFSMRLADNLALLECIVERPITGWGSDSKNLSDSLFSLGSITNSNGVLYATAELGLPYGIVWVMLVFLCLKRLYGCRLAIGLTFALILAQMNEVGYFLPIIYIYFFKYKNMIGNNYG